MIYTEESLVSLSRRALSLELQLPQNSRRSPSVSSCTYYTLPFVRGRYFVQRILASVGMPGIAAGADFACRTAYPERCVTLGPRVPRVFSSFDARTYERPRRKKSTFIEYRRPKFL